MTETITVAADAGRLQIQTESAERSDLVTNKQLRDLALNGRNIGDLFKTIPGVIAGGTQTTSTVANVVGSFNINGTRNNQHEYTVDGVTNLNLGNNTGALVSINPDALEEVKILTSNYQAEYGRAGGGFIALTTRGGHQRATAAACATSGATSAQRQQLLQQAPARPAQAALPLRLLGWDFGGPVPLVGSARQPRDVLLRGPGVLPAADAGRRGAEHPRARPRSSAAAISRRPVTATATPSSMRDPLTGQPFPDNIDPVEPVRAGHAGAARHLPARRMPRGRRRSTTTPRSSPATSRGARTSSRFDWQVAPRRRGSASATSTTRTRTSGPTARRPRPSTSRSSNIVRKNGPGTTLSATADPRLQPEPGRTSSSTAWAGAASSSGPVDDLSTRASHGVDAPLLFGERRSRRHPARAWRSAASANQCASPTPTSTARPFDQKFIIHNVIRAT